MTTDFEITDKELREVYELLTKEQLIDALIRKHKECRDIAKNCVIPAVIRSKNFLEGILKLKHKLVSELKSTDKINSAQFIMQEPNIFIQNYSEKDMDEFIMLNL